MSNPMETSGKCTVLVVDDMPDNLSVMSGLLRPDYKVKLANSGERALQIVAGDGKPDLILLDIMMPEMDGYEAITRIRSQDRFQKLPVIGQTTAMLLLRKTPIKKYV